MNPDLRLCAHLSEPDLAELPIDPADILDWHDGPVTAVARCPLCPRLGFLELLEWDHAAGVRLFTLAGLDPQAFAIYRRDVDRGSCDPARLARETTALHSSTGPVERLVTLRVSDGALLRVETPPAGFHLPDVSREQRLAARAGWSIWRQDDNGSRFEVARRLSLADAGPQLDRFEARGHKQHYWLAPTR